MNHGFNPVFNLYLNSLFYLPIVKYYTFYIPTVLFLVFSNQILISEIFKKLKKKKIDYTLYLSLLFFVFINVFFYRLQEHGVDRSAQILVLILILYLLSLINFDKNFEKNLIKIFIISGIIISLKALYLLYLAVSIPIIYIFFKVENFFIFYIFKNKFFGYLFYYQMSC